MESGGGGGKNPYTPGHIFSMAIVTVKQSELYSNVRVKKSKLYSNAEIGTREPREQKTGLLSILTLLGRLRKSKIHQRHLKLADTLIMSTRQIVTPNNSPRCNRIVQMY